MSNDTTSNKILFMIILAFSLAGALTMIILAATYSSSSWPLVSTLFVVMAFTVNSIASRIAKKQTHDFLNNTDENNPIKSAGFFFCGFLATSSLALPLTLFRSGRFTSRDTLITIIGNAFVIFIMYASRIHYFSDDEDNDDDF